MCGYVHVDSQKTIGIISLLQPCYSLGSNVGLEACLAAGHLLVISFTSPFVWIEVVGFESRTMHILGIRSTTELHPLPAVSFYSRHLGPRELSS